jgi:hypothetical protein
MSAIAFSAPMVRALLDGRKTQTRREMTCKNTLFNGRKWTIDAKVQRWAWDKAWVDGGPSPAGNSGPYLKLPWAAGDADPWEDTVHRIYPRVQPGDCFWVKEAVACGADALPAPSTWSAQYWRETQGTASNPTGLWYEADGLSPERPIAERGRWVSATFMPRWASRITLEVTEVRVQRLQDISEQDAKAEGVTRPMVLHDDDGTSFVDAFRDLWFCLHGPGSWDANPWVVAISFKRLG